MNKWTPPRNSGGISLVSTRFSLSMEMNRLTRDGTVEPVSRDQILRHERGQGNIHFPCSADHVQDWQPYPVDPYSCYMCDHKMDDGAPWHKGVLQGAEKFMASWHKEEEEASRRRASKRDSRDLEPPTHL